RLVKARCGHADTRAVVPSSRPATIGSASALRRPVPGGALARALPIVLVLAIVGATIGAVLAFSSARSLAQAENRQVRADSLIEIKAELSWLHHELLLDGVLAYQQTGSATPPDDLDRIRSERADLVARLDDLAATPDATGRSATEVADRVRATPIDTWPMDLWAIEDLHYETMPFVNRSAGGERDTAAPAPSATATITTAQLIDGAQTVPIPRLVLLDALALELVTAPEPLPIWGEDFLVVVAEVVVDNPGWFGPDPERPLVDHVMRSSGSRASLVAPAAQASGSLDLVVGYDRWLVAGGPDAGPPPATIEELAAAADVTTAAMIEAVRDGFDNRRSAQGGSALLVGSIRVRVLLGGTLSLVAVTLLVVGLVWWNRHRHRLADAAYTDALTGAGNRRYLDDVVAGRLRRSGQTHLVAMLDMDRFKLVNDTWGHDAGDAVLRALSVRLQNEVDAFCQVRPGSSSAVIRLGGDEFAVIVHGPVGFDTDQLEQRLRGLAGPVTLAQGDLVDVAFSFGSAVSHEPCHINDLLKAADLATYEDKQRPPTRPPTRPAVVDVAAMEAG
ncbi:MAG: GGDEF domain-containing protein, partial [Actinomycetota bacterium]